MKNLLKKIHTEVIEKQYDSVVWLGVHPWLPVILNVLIEEGVTNILVIDNDIKKQGTIIYPYKNASERNGYVVEGFNRNTRFSHNPIFFMANTHYQEFVNQLSKFGIGRERILNLHQETLVEPDFVHDGKMFAEKCGFKLLKGRSLQLRQYEILKEFKKICNDFRLTYWIGGGTLLGAVRHNGFIPWDDDIDVYMPFKDYMRLLREFPVNNKYNVVNWRLQDNCAMTFTKIIDCDTYLIHDKWFPYLYTMGCYIDIFPLGGYPRTQNLIKEKWEFDEQLDRDWNYYYVMRDVKPCLDCRESIVRKKFSIPFESAHMVGAMHRIMQKRWAVRKEVFSETINIRFEDEEFSAPIGYDEYLTVRYGNYMEMPPKNKQVSHSFFTYDISKTNGRL